jgi:hypothetical protein
MKLNLVEMNSIWNNPKEIAIAHCWIGLHRRPMPQWPPGIKPSCTSQIGGLQWDHANQGTTNAWAERTPRHGHRGRATDMAQLSTVRWIFIGDKVFGLSTLMASATIRYMGTKNRWSEQESSSARQSGRWQPSASMVETTPESVKVLLSRLPSCTRASWTLGKA